MFVFAADRLVYLSPYVAPNWTKQGKFLFFCVIMRYHADHALFMRDRAWSMHDHTKPFFFEKFAFTRVHSARNKNKFFMRVPCVISKILLFCSVSGSRVTNPCSRVIFRCTKLLQFVCNKDFPHLSITLDHILLGG